jgi:polyphosphate kinase
MDFCTDKEYTSFFADVELYEKMLANAGFIILKYYLDISKDEQDMRLMDRRKDPLKQWKISPIDREALRYWKDYSDARNKMLLKTNFDYAPWFVVNAENKKAAHNAVISHLLSQLSYHDKNKKLVSGESDLVYPATSENIKTKLF